MKIAKLIALSIFFSSLIAESFAQNTREWSIVATYTIPGKNGGLAWDGTYLYGALLYAPGDDNIIYRIDPSDGSYVQQCAGPFQKAYGLTFDGTYLWTTDHPAAYDPADAIQFDMSGNFVSSFDLPTTYMSGIAWDEGRFWSCAYYNPDGMAYKLTSTGGIITQWPTPDAQPWAICTQGDYLWIADYWGDMIYKTDTLGNVIESHPTVGSDPTAVVFDGLYLWYCDGPSNAPSTLYKVDLGGVGTPEINIPVDAHDYGSVTVGQSSTWNMSVENIGNADLDITGVVIPEGEPISTTFTPPQTIPPNQSITIPLTYQPVDPIPLNTVVTIQSSDPVTPEVPVTLTGEGVLAGPHMIVSSNSHDYGIVRVNAWTRWFLEVSNDGNLTLTISDIIINLPNFVLDEGVELPIDIPSLDTVKIGVWFNPEEETSYGDFMEIYHNGSNQNPYQIYLGGAGVEKEWPMGNMLWFYTIDVSYDNSPKAISPINDITGDKISDVIVCSEDDYVRCFNGNSHNLADVMWERSIYAGTTYSQAGLTIIDDIDNDEYQEVIVGTAWGDRSVICYSGKTGVQMWKFDTHAYGSGGWVYQVDARFDYNGDGVIDVLASTGDDATDTGPKRIFCLDALDGGLIWDCFTNGPNFSVIGVEDFTGDGIPDVVAGASNSDETQGRVYGINGETGTIMWYYTTVGSSVWALEQLLDINDDGVQDVAIGDFSGYVQYLDGTNGDVLETTSVGVNLILRFELIDDVNDDGHPDILVANSGTNAVAFSGLDASTIWIQSMPDKPWNLAGANDLTGDGVSDVMIGTLYSNNYLFFMDGTSGEELYSIHYQSAVDAINSIPDIVGDDSYEMVAGGREGTVTCYSGGPVPPPTAVPENPAERPVSFHSNAWPNPSSDDVTIGFYIPAGKHVLVEIYSASGRLVNTLFESDLHAGEHQVSWNGSDASGNPCASGIYLYRVTAGDAHSTGSIIRTVGR